MGLRTEKIIVNGKEYDLTSTGGYDVNIVDNLETADSTSALSANQGKILNDKVEDIKTQSVVAEYDEETEHMTINFNVPAQGIIENTLESDNEFNALSAKQGKVLNNAINEVKNSSKAKYISSSTGVDITYDNNWVNVSFVIQNYNISGEDNTTITLPDNVQMKHDIYATEIFLNHSWYPTSNTAYIRFAIDHKIHIISSNSVTNVVLTFNRTYPRSAFTITEN